ncbi:MAG: hypothetical protein RLZ98_2698 [Pseudomonadota bacterium]|jgi:hypothetical protein
MRRLIALVRLAIGPVVALSGAPAESAPATRYVRSIDGVLGPAQPDSRCFCIC